MPQAPLRPCSAPGCHTLVVSGRCPQHARTREQQRGSAAARGYDRRWDRRRRLFLARHPLCGDRIEGPSTEHSRCVRESRVTAATDVDHIVPHRGDARLFWDERNWQSLCHTCHSIKTATFGR